MPPGRPLVLTEVLRSFFAARPELRPELTDGQGELRRDVRVFVGDADARALAGLATVVPAGCEVWLVPPSAGG